MRQGEAGWVLAGRRRWPDLSKVPAAGPFPGGAAQPVDVLCHKWYSFCGKVNIGQTSPAKGK